jgi:polar amino acid transport system substrate-binding protein
MRSLRSLALLVVLPVALVLGACGDDDDDAGDTTGDTEPATEVEAPEGLVDGGALTVCSDTPYEPFEYEAADGVQIGYDMDLLRAIAEDAGLELAVLDLPFDGILGSLAAGDCDVVASAVTITEERAQQVDFSEPYFDADQSLLVRAEDEATYGSLADLGGQRIAVQSGTTGEEYANANKPEGAEVVAFEDSDGLFAAIASGDVAAVLQDFPVNAYRAVQDDDFVVTERFATGEQYGFAVAKGNTGVLQLIDEGLGRLREDGRFDEIFEDYFGESE